MPGLVLIVEDEPLLARNVRTYLSQRGYEAEIAGSVAAALRRYGDLQPDAVLIDHNLPDGTGLSIIREIRKQDRWTKLVMITAHGGVDVAVEAMKSGADDYLAKPVSLKEIGILVDKLLAQSRTEGSLDYFKSRERAQSGLSRIEGASEAITGIKQRLKVLIAAERAAGPEPGPSVLILGETGTGKELIARALHFDGVRAAQPFVSVNCAALPDHLVESELFGHERGAFTGATEKRIGLFQAAEGGTLFLDEVGELPPQQQSKLLRALEDRVIRPLGSTRDRPINVRVIAATNSEVERSSKGEFRQDLLFRLNTVTISIPPLRERPDDILLLTELFIREFQVRYARSRLTITPGARAALKAYAWPGNVRQLRNVMEQACLTCARDQIDTRDIYLPALPPLARAEAAPPTAAATNLVEVERSLIVGTLKSSAGNVTLAARALGISRDTLRYRMEKHAIRRSDLV